MTNTDKYKFITFDELVDAIENDKAENSFKSAADNLLEAVTDWPTEELKEPSEIIVELKKLINGKLTFDNLTKYYETLSVDNDSWKMESLYSILELYDFNRNCNIDKEIELEEIVSKITLHYRK